MRGTDIVRVVAVTAFVLLHSGCASHRPAMCPKPAKVFGTFTRSNPQGGWVIVREDRSAEDTATRIAANYHVRTQPLTYVHGFSTYPVPQEPKFLCDKAVLEVHYAAPSSVAAR